MHDGVGIALIVDGAAVGLLFALPLRTRAPAALVGVILALCGAALGAGALLVQDHDVSTTNWVIVMVFMPVLAPAHVRVVLGRFGPAGRGLPPPEKVFGTPRTPDPG